ncbi:major facilitator superfamily domain-containing protein [Xylogone sp. PMI_703]|nr:major facilitator superfamily domain-containing protein [Xylogone sp. PMI_703]
MPITKRKRTWRFFSTFGCLGIINLMCAVDATILSVALPKMAMDLHGSSIEAFWAGTSFLLTSTVFQPSWASFSDIIGRRIILLFALTLFTIGTLVASGAGTFTLVLVGRSIQGAGGGGLIALTYVMVTDMVTLRDRGRWFSIISIQWAIGSVAGPVIGGVLTEKSTWRWIFWLNIPFCLAAFILVPLSLRLNNKAGSVIEKLKAVDWMGMFLFVSSATGFLIPLTWGKGGIMYDWGSWHTVFPLTISLVGMIVFILYSKYLSSHPLINGSIFQTSTAKVGYFGSFIHGIIVWSLLYYMPIYYLAAKNLDPIASSIAIIPLTAASVPIAIIVGFVITKIGKYMLLLWIGWILTTSGLALLTLLHAGTTTLQWIFLSLPVGIGTGILYSAQSYAVQASASNEDLPFAAAMYSFFRFLGQTFGVAFGSTMFVNGIKGRLPGDWAKYASTVSSVIRYLPNNNIKSDIVDAYVYSLRDIWIVLCALSSIALVLSLVFVRDIPLDRELETQQGFKYHAKTRLPEDRRDDY